MVRAAALLFESPIDVPPMDALCGKFVKKGSFNGNDFFVKDAIGDYAALAMFTNGDVPTHSFSGTEVPSHAWLISDLQNMADVWGYAHDTDDDGGPPCIGWGPLEDATWFCSIRPDPNAASLKRVPPLGLPTAQVAKVAKVMTETQKETPKVTVTYKRAAKVMTQTAKGEGVVKPVSQPVSQVANDPVKPRTPTPPPGPPPGHPVSQPVPQVTHTPPTPVAKPLPQKPMPVAKKTPSPPMHPPPVTLHVSPAKPKDPLTRAVEDQFADCTGEVQNSGSTADRDAWKMACGVEPIHIDLAVEAEAFIEDVMEQIRIRSNDNKKRGGWFNKSQVLCEAILMGNSDVAEYIANKWVNKNSESYNGDESGESYWVNKNSESYTGDESGESYWV